MHNHIAEHLAFHKMRTGTGNKNSTPIPDVQQPAAGSVAASAPTAPSKPIDADYGDDAFGTGDGGTLPFEL